ncbi:MAG: D-glycero-beta-D-manno-heptose-7-phosphate kinase [Ignavibacteriae bacterium HGW-Ignavibacteriae-3]|nr:MAG: D-glycero-beta-D-manno-heptose-7-phosphate kinase [Ignavibacteriae bacterium HGW-Ignavibacteriae-3]
MIDVSQNKLNALKNKFKGKRIAVIGDLMLDCYYWGGVSRISPEAPVPILQVDNEFYRFGGAMNVALNVSTLGGIPFPIGVIGNDGDGRIFKKLLKERSIDGKGIVVDSKRPTTAKTRVIADKQHVVRIDKERTNSISPSIEKKILSLLKKEIGKIDAIIIEDYNKGVLTENLIKQIISLANNAKKIITVDPKFLNFFSYNNVTVFKPNRKETEDAFGIWINSEEDISNAGWRLIEKLNCKYVLLTLGEKGIALFEKGKPERRVPTIARKVADVSGAGDTVISTLTMALTAGADIFDAAYLANYAGGLVCQEVGIVPIELNTLFNAVAKEIK